MTLVLQAWIALAVIFTVGELMSPGLILLPFGMGAATAALLNLGGASMGWQWVAFLGISSTLLVISQRVLAARKRRRSAE